MWRDTYFFKKSQGNAAIEFALVLPLLFLLLSGVINFGLILVNQNQLNGVVSAGMLYAFGNSSNPTAVQTAMLNSTTNLDFLTPPTATTFCECTMGVAVSPCPATCPGGAPVAKYVTVTAQSQVDLVALDFLLPNPFITNAQGTIRTQK